MGTWSKILLSGSTDGQGISATGLTPSTGTLLHTAVTGQGNSIDEVVLYAAAGVTVARKIVITVGPTTATGSQYTHTLPAGDVAGLQPIMPGLPVQNSMTVKAVVTTVTTIGEITLWGWVNRYAS